MSAFRAYGRCVFGFAYNDLSAFGTVICRNSVSPPKLTRYAPVADIVRPVEICFFKSFGNKFDILVANRRRCGLYQVVHFDEPLFLYHRLDNGLAAVVCADVVRIVLYANKQAHLVEFFDNLRSCRISVHARELTAVFVYRGVVVHDVDFGQVVAFADLEVVRVVRRGNLYNARSEVFFNIFVCNNGYFSVNKRNFDRFADKVFVSLVVGVNRNGGISEHRFGTCRRKFKITAVFAYNRVFDVPKMTVLLLVFDFRVGYGRVANGAPVDYLGAFVDKPLVIHIDKYFFNGAGTTLVHGEAFTRPVAGRTEFFKLVYYAVAVLFFPRPCVFEELFAAYLVFVDALALQLLNNFDLGRNACVVRSRLPKRGISLHSFVADKNILHGVVKRVSHVQLSRYVRRRDNYGERLFRLVYFCFEIVVFYPKIVNSVFEITRVVCFVEFFHFSLRI